jgi:hypothetical protein
VNGMARGGYGANAAGKVEAGGQLPRSWVGSGLAGTGLARCPSRGGKAVED